MSLRGSPKGFLRVDAIGAKALVVLDIPAWVRHFCSSLMDEHYKKWNALVLESICLTFNNFLYLIKNTFNISFICRYLIFIHGSFQLYAFIMNAIGNNLKIFHCGEMTNMTNSPLYEIKQDDRDIIRGWDSLEHFPEYKYMYFSERTGIQRCFVSLLLVLGLTNVAGREIK